MDGMGRKLRKGRALVRGMSSSSRGVSASGGCDEDSAIWGAFSGSFTDSSTAGAVSGNGNIDPGIT